MAVPLKYVGPQSRYFDTVDGSREQWTPGDSSDVSDAAALGLIATGLFAAVEGARDAYTLAELNALAAAGGLVPFATYIPRGESPAYQMWASSASVIGMLGSGSGSVTFSTAPLSASAVVKGVAGDPGNFISLLCTSVSGGKVTVRDGGTVSGALIPGLGGGGASGLALTAGQYVSLGAAVYCANGIYLEINGTVSVVVLYQ